MAVNFSGSNCEGYLFIYLFILVCPAKSSDLQCKIGAIKAIFFLTIFCSLCLFHFKFTGMDYRSL